MARQSGTSQAPIAGRTDRVHELGHPVGVDDRNQPIEQGDQVGEKDRAQEERVQGEADELDPVEPQHDPGQQRDDQDRGGREAERTARRTGVEVAESREEEGQKCRPKRRPCARSRVLRVVHRG